MSKWLCKILKPFVGTISDSHIQNNTDLIDKLNRIEVNYEFKLVSFDVKSLFTNVPLTEFFDFLRDEFANYPFPIPLDDIIDLLKLCLCNLNFTFNDEFYEQKFGCAMGNPVSPIVSNFIYGVF